MSVLNIGTGSYYGDGSYGAGATYNGGVSYSGRTRNASAVNFRTMGRNITAGYNADIEIIQKYFKDGKTDRAIEKYESLFDEIRQSTSGYNYSLTDSEVESILKSAYESTTGVSVVTAVEKNTSGSFWTGVKEAIPLLGWLANGTSEAEATAKIAGDKVSGIDTAKEVAGAITVAGLPAAATLAIGGVSALLGGWGIVAGVWAVASLATAVTKMASAK